MIINKNDKRRIKKTIKRSKKKSIAGKPEWQQGWLSYLTEKDKQNKTKEELKEVRIEYLELRIESLKDQIEGHFKEILKAKIELNELV